MTAVNYIGVFIMFRTVAKSNDVLKAWLDIQTQLTELTLMHTDRVEFIHNHVHISVCITSVEPDT